MAWWVVAGHIGRTVGANAFVLEHNTLAVYVFVVLSGFVIARLLDLKREHYRAYLTRRAFRLFPLYIVVLVASTLLLPVQRAAFAAMLQYSAENADRVRLATVALANVPAHFIPHLLLLHGIVPNALLPDAAYTIVGQAWSISLEWQFYIAAPLIFFALQRKVGRYAVIFGCVILGIAGWRISPAFLGSLLSLFMLGITCYLNSRDGKWIGGMVLSALAAFAQVGPLVAIPLGIWAVVFASVRGWLAINWLGSKPLVYLGERSFSVYMVHMLCLYVTAFLWPNPAAVGFVTIFGTLALSELTYRFIEKPGINAGALVARQLTKRADGVPGSVGRKQLSG